MVDKVFPWIDLIALFIELRTWQQHFGLDPHQCGSHQNKLARELNIEALQLMEVGQNVVGDLGNGYIVDIEFVAFNEEKEKVKRPFKQRQMDFEVFLLHKSGCEIISGFNDFQHCQDLFMIAGPTC